MPLPWNQIIEGWWLFLHRSRVAWWINFFKDFCNRRTIDLTSQLEKEYLRFYFGGLLHSYVSNILKKWERTGILIISEAQDTTPLKCNLIRLLKNYLLTEVLLRVPKHERDFCKAGCYWERRRERLLQVRQGNPKLTNVVSLERSI